MRDEQALRRPGFRDGTAVRLADGQNWVLPAPVEDRPDAAAAPVFDADYEAIVAAVAEAHDVSERLLAELCLAIYLLQRNYDLGPADYRQLLEYPADDPGLAALQTALHGVSLSHARALAQRAVSAPKLTARRRLTSVVRFVTHR